MKKTDIPKLELFISGMLSRLDGSGEELFKSLRFTMKSGGREFAGSAALSGGPFTVRWNGALEIVAVESFPKWFSNAARQFDEARLTLSLRTSATEVEVTERGVRTRNMKPDEEPVQVAGDREYIIKPGTEGANKLLREIGILTSEKGGAPKIKNGMARKYSQIDHFVELIAPMIDRISSDRLVVWDLACGKSYLSFVLNYYLCELRGRKCRVTGVDIRQDVVDESRRMASELGYANMEFLQADLRDFAPETKPDIVVSLHACDVATDYALAAAVRNRAKAIICVPCCHKELEDKISIEGLEPLITGVFRARLNDVLTDSLRCLRLQAAGYRVGAVEYISPLDTPKNLMLRAEKGLDKASVEKAARDYKLACEKLGVTPMLDKLL